MKILNIYTLFNVGPTEDFVGRETKIILEVHE